MRAFAVSMMAAVLVWAAFPAPAAARDFPADAVRAHFTVLDPQTVKLGRKVFRLSIAAQIRDSSNRIVMATSLPGERYPSLYLLDKDGNVSRVWLLTDDEEAALKAQKR